MSQSVARKIGKLGMQRAMGAISSIVPYGAQIRQAARVASQAYRIGRKVHNAMKRSPKTPSSGGTTAVNNKRMKTAESDAVLTYSNSIKEDYMKAIINKNKGKYVGSVVKQLVQHSIELQASSGSQTFQIIQAYGAKNQWLSSANYFTNPLIDTSPRAYFDLAPEGTIKVSGINGPVANVPLSSWKFALQNVSCEIMMSNFGETAVVLDLYIVHAKKSTDRNPTDAFNDGVTQSQESTYNGFAADQANAGSAIQQEGSIRANVPGTNPERYLAFKQLYAVDIKKNINIDPGETKKVNVSVVLNMIKDKRILSDANEKAYGRNTTFIVAKFHGIPVKNNLAQNEILQSLNPVTTAPCSVGCVVTNNLFFRSVKGVAELQTQPYTGISIIPRDIPNSQLSFIKDATDQRDTLWEKA